MSYWTCPPTFSSPADQFVSQDELKALLTGYDPPCQPLLFDPLAVLGDKARWPRHLCFELLRDSAERWARGAFLRDVQADDYASLFPLPLGRAALITEARVWRLNPRGLLNVIPFAGQERAALALRLRVANQTVDLFGLVAPIVDEEQLAHVLETVPGADREKWTWRLADEHIGERLYCLGQLTYQVRGDDPANQAVARVVDLARRWWASFVGKPLGGGRPTGSGTFASRDDFHATVGAVVQDLRRRGLRPTQTRVAEYLSSNSAFLSRQARPDEADCDPRRLREWCEAFGYASWQDFLADID